MGGSLYLAWRYLRHHRMTTAILIAAITLIAFLPAGLEVIVRNAAEHFRARADSTPLLVGARGSPLQLVLGALYFDEQDNEILRMSELARIEEQSLAEAIPLHTRFRARHHAIVGTTAEYARLRELRTSNGRTWRMLGECVVGARVAQRLDIGIGGKIPVSSESAFTLDDAPLRLNVVGIYAARETPDDDAIFVDLKTAWIIEGLGHGHAPNAGHGTAAAAEYTDITEDNVGSFHFHGDRGKFPLTAIIALPRDRKSETLLLGQYLSPDDTAQAVRPGDVMDGLLARILMVRSYIVAIVAVVSSVTLLTIALVVVLSIRLRRRELVTMTKMGCSRLAITAILGSQIAMILAVSAVAAAGLALLTDAYGREIVRLLVL